MATTADARVCAFASTGVGILFLDLLPVILRCPSRATKYFRDFTDRSIDRLKRESGLSRGARRGRPGAVNWRAGFRPSWLKRTRIAFGA
jgi:hypothetical protein